MTWNYRIVRMANGDLCLHEVYYTDKGIPYTRTVDPIIAVDAEEGKKAIKKELSMMMADVVTRTILEEGDIELAADDAQKDSYPFVVPVDEETPPNAV